MKSNPKVQFCETAASIQSVESVFYGLSLANHSFIKGDLSPNKNVANNYDRATPERFGVLLAYVRSREGSQKAGPVEVSCDVTPHLVAYQTAGQRAICGTAGSKSTDVLEQ